MDPSYWSKIERGPTDPGIANLLRMQYALRLDTLEPLFDYTSLDALSARPAAESQAA